MAKYTLLEAVNFILFCSGLQKLASGTDVTALTTGYEKDAYDLLLQESRRLQSIGLQCNTFEYQTLTSNLIGDIDGTVLDILTSTQEHHITILKDPSQADALAIYDKDNNQFLTDFSNKYTIIKELSWDELPSIVQEYIVYLTAEKFTKFTNQAVENIQLILKDLQDIEREFKATETRRGLYSLFNNPRSHALVHRIMNPHSWLLGRRR